MPSFIPPVNTDNVLTGVASMFWQPYDMTVDAAPPEDTVALGTPWSDPWVSIGATDAGLELDFERKTNNIMIEEQVVEVDEVTESMTWSMNIDMAEDTLQTMRLSMGGGVITDIAATASTPGVRTLQLSTDMDNFAFGYEVVNQFGQWRRIVVPKVKSVAKTKTNYSRAKNKRMWTTQFVALCAPEKVIIREWTSAPTP